VGDEALDDVAVDAFDEWKTAGSCSKRQKGGWGLILTKTKE